MGSTYGQLECATARKGLSGKWRHETRLASLRIRWPIAAGTVESRTISVDGNFVSLWPRGAVTAYGMMRSAGRVYASFAKWKPNDICPGAGAHGYRHPKCWCDGGGRICCISVVINERCGRQAHWTLSSITDLHFVELTYNQRCIQSCATFFRCHNVMTRNRPLSIRYSVSFKFALNNSSSEPLKSQIRRRQKT